MSKTSISIFAAIFILLLGFAANNERTNTPADDYAEPEKTIPVFSGSDVEVYSGISVPSNVTELDVSGRGLDGSLKAEVRLLAELKVLDVSSNNFTGLPAEVGQLSKLEVLNLSGNPFTGLPHELGNLQNLKRLDLRDTQYSEFDLEVIRKSLPSETEILL